MCALSVRIASFRSRINWWRVFLLIFLAATGLFGPASRASQTVVDAGSSVTFSLPAAATNYTWRLDGTLSATNGQVGSNSAAFTYTPAVFEVGTHLLTCGQTFAGGVASNSYWQVRVRLPQPVSGTNFYVAPNGADTNPGTLAAPFLTLEQARNSVRALPRPLPAGGVTVWLRGGTYFRTNTLMLTNGNDSGTVAAPVVYRGYPNETAVISGGKAIPAASFVPLNASQTNRVAPGLNPTNLWELDLASAGITHTSLPASFNTWTIVDPYNPAYSGNLCELIYNGQRMFLSRYPNHNPTNDDLLTPNMLMNGVATDASGTNYLNAAGTYTDSNQNLIPVGGAFHYGTNDAAHVARWQTALTNGGLWLQGYWLVAWAVNGTKVRGIDTNALVFEMATNATPQGGFGSAFIRPKGSYQEPFWALNLLEEIDQPGEWAMDFNRHKIYFYAPGPLTNGSVVISDLAVPLVQVGGGSNIVFQSLTFTAGLAQGIYLTNGVQDLIVGCTFYNLGNYAADILNGGNNGVVDCNLHDLAGGGVLLRGGYETNNAALRIPARDFVVNNLITNFSRVARVYAAAVEAGYGGALLGNHEPAVGMRVAHNLIAGSPHSAVLHGSWDSVFEYNDIGEYQMVSDDLGAFYSYDYLWRHGNHTFRYNFMHDTPLGNGIDFDQDHFAMHIYGNVTSLKTSAAESQGYGVIYHDGTQATNGNQQSVECYNNLFCNSHYGAQFEALLPSTIEANAAVLCPTAYLWKQVLPGTPANSFVTSSQTAMQSGPNLNYAGDPGFINLASNDCRLLPSAAVYTDMPAFSPIPFEMIGLYNDESRTNAPGFSPYVTSGPTTALGSGSATLNGSLVYPQFDSNTTVFVCWGTNDGGTSIAGWQNTTSLGLQNAGALATHLTGLADTTYYYRFFATNVFGQAWGPAAVAFTPFAPGHTPANITWAGDGIANLWNKNTNNPVWLAANSPVAFWDGDTVTFDDTGSDTPSINLTATNSPAFVEVNATQNYTFGGFGKISGNTGLQKDGGGSLTILTTNDYNGATVINQGLLTVGNGAVSGTLGSGPVTNNATLQFNQPDNTTVSSVISGPGNLGKTGGGTLTLAANNTFTGPLTVTGGTVAIGTDSNLGAPGNSLVLAGGALQITSGGLFTFNNRPLTLNAGGGTLSLANTLTVTNAITGPGSLALSGGGTLILAASNTFAGQTTVNASLLQLSNGGTGGSLNGGIVLSAGSLLIGRTNSAIPAGPITSVSSLSCITNSGTLPGAICSHAFADGSNSFNVINNNSGGTLGLNGAAGCTNVLSGNLYNSPGSLALNGGFWFLSANWQPGGASVALNGATVIAGGGMYGFPATNLVIQAGTLLVSGGQRCSESLANATFSMTGGNLIISNTTYGFRFGNSGANNAQQSGYLAFNGTQTGGNIIIVSNTAEGSFSLGGYGPVAAPQSINYTLSGGSIIVPYGPGNGDGIWLGADSNQLASTTFTLCGTGKVLAYNVKGGQSAASGARQIFNFSGGTLASFAINLAALQSSNAPGTYGTLYNNGGTLAPGDLGVPGKTTITGNLTNYPGSALAIDLGGSTQASAFQSGSSNYDFVAISGAAALNGGLNVSLMNHFQPAATNSFTVLTAASLSGGFTNVIGGRVAVVNATGASFQVVTTATSILLTNYQSVVAGFTAAATNGLAPFTANFTDTSLGGITNRAWNFGDGSTTNTAALAVSHLYPNPGSYQVILTVSGPAGVSSTNCIVQVTMPPPAPVFTGIQWSGTNLIFTSANGLAGENILLLAATNLTLPTVNWTVLATNQFDAGGNLNLTNPVMPGATPWFFRLRYP